MGVTTVSQGPSENRARSHIRIAVPRLPGWEQRPRRPVGEASEETRMEVTCPALAPGLRAKPGAAPTLLLLPRASDCVSGTLGPRACSGARLLQKKVWIFPDRKQTPTCWYLVKGVQSESCCCVHSFIHSLLHSFFHPPITQPVIHLPTHPPIDPSLIHQPPTAHPPTAHPSTQWADVKSLSVGARDRTLMRPRSSSQGAHTQQKTGPRSGRRAITPL